MSPGVSRGHFAKCVTALYGAPLSRGFGQRDETSRVLAGFAFAVGERTAVRGEIKSSRGLMLQ